MPPATSASDKAVYILLGKYDTLYKERYGTKPRYNRFKEKWAMQDVIDSVGVDRSLELIEYYFKVTKPGHPLTWFFYNFDRLDAMLVNVEEDKKRRATLLEQTKRMVEESEYGSSSN